MTRAFFAILAAVALTVGALGATVVPETAAAQSAKPKKKGLKGSIGYRRAYSYSKQDVVGADNRRFYDPSKTRQTPGGPFDNGFFFDSAIGRNGGEAPYMQ
jgi:hypothetical protein